MSRNGFWPTLTWALRPQASQWTEGQAPILPPVGSDGRDLGTTCACTSISIPDEVSGVMTSSNPSARGLTHQRARWCPKSIIKLTTVRISSRDE
jgi:hypothetical protein